MINIKYSESCYAYFCQQKGIYFCPFLFILFTKEIYGNVFSYQAISFVKQATLNNLKWAFNFYLPTLPSLSNLLPYPHLFFHFFPSPLGGQPFYNCGWNHIESNVYLFVCSLGTWRWCQNCDINLNGTTFRSSNFYSFIQRSY